MPERENSLKGKAHSKRNDFSESPEVGVGDIKGEHRRQSQQRDWKKRNAPKRCTKNHQSAKGGDYRRENEGSSKE